MDGRAHQGSLTRPRRAGPAQELPRRGARQAKEALAVVTDTRPLTGRTHPAAATDERVSWLRRHGPTVLLFILFFGVYVSFSARFIGLPIAKWRGEYLFASDSARVIRSLTGPATATDHKQTSVHPLFSILYSPPALGLTTLLGSYLASVPIIIALFGALGVVLVAPH